MSTKQSYDEKIRKQINRRELRDLHENPRFHQKIHRDHQKRKKNDWLDFEDWEDFADTYSTGGEAPTE